MLWDVVFWLGLVVSAAIGFVYFRDLGDVSQMIMKVKRANMARFIKHEYKFLSIGLGAALIAAVAHLGFGGGPRALFWIMVVLLGVFYAFPWVYVHLGLRNQKASARYYSIQDAKEYVSPAS
jgi:Na+/alanine symporter